MPSGIVSRKKSIFGTIYIDFPVEFWSHLAPLGRQFSPKNHDVHWGNALFGPPGRPGVDFLVFHRFLTDLGVDFGAFWMISSSILVDFWYHFRPQNAPLRRSDEATNRRCDESTNRRIDESTNRRIDESTNRRTSNK